MDRNQLRYLAWDLGSFIVPFCEQAEAAKSSGLECGDGHYLGFYRGYSHTRCADSFSSNRRHAGKYFLCSLSVCLAARSPGYFGLVGTHCSFPKASKESRTLIGSRSHRWRSRDTSRILSRPPRFSLIEHRTILIGSFASARDCSPMGMFVRSPRCHIARQPRRVVQPGGAYQG